MATAAIDGLEAALQRRRAEGLFRERRTVDCAPGPHPRVAGRSLIAFASNDYLGLASDARLIAAQCEATRRWGVGSGASHLVSGHHAPHEQLERALAGYIASAGLARALTFSTGYLANLAILSALAQRDGEIFADKLNHACLNDGALLARARLVRYAHADASSLEARLAASQTSNKLIATDAVFSMDGDSAPLPALLRVAEKYDAWLVVDDAHGFGVLGDGRGSLAQCNLASERIVYMATLGKAAGVAGAFVVAHPAVVETIVQTARPYIFSTAAPAALAATLVASLELIRAAADERAHLHRLIARFRERAGELPWRLLPSTTPIQPLLLGSASAAVQLSDALYERGIWVPAIRPPTVPRGTARLRISLSAAHSADDVDQLLDALLVEAGRAA